MPKAVLLVALLREDSQESTWTLLQARTASSKVRCQLICTQLVLAVNSPGSQPQSDFKPL